MGVWDSSSAVSRRQRRRTQRQAEGGVNQNAEIAVRRPHAAHSARALHLLHPAGLLVLLWFDLVLLCSNHARAIRSVERPRLAYRIRQETPRASLRATRHWETPWCGVPRDRRHPAHRRFGDVPLAPHRCRIPVPMSILPKWFTIPGMHAILFWALFSTALGIDLLGGGLARRSDEPQGSKIGHHRVRMPWAASLRGTLLAPGRVAHLADWPALEPVLRVGR